MIYEPMILIIEEDTIFRESCRKHLESCGYTALEAESGRSGMDIFKLTKPDLVILDLKTKENNDSISLEKLIKKSPDIPVIVTAEIDNMSEVGAALNKGAWDYILKPLDNMILLEHSVKQAFEYAELKEENNKHKHHNSQEIKKKNQELQRTTKSMKECQEMYRILAENMTDNLWILDLKTFKTIYSSPSVEKIFGYTPEEVTKLNLEDVLIPDSLKYLMEVVQEEISYDNEREPDRNRTLEATYIKKDGSQVSVEINARFLRDEEGIPVRILGVTRDVTQRKQADEKMRKSEALAKSVIESIPDLMTVHDKDMNIIMSNWYGHEYIADEEREGSPKCYSTYMHRDSPCTPCNAKEVLKTGKPKNIVMKNPVDGITREINVFPVFDCDGEPIMVAEHVRNISERIKNEQAIRESEAKYSALVENSKDGIVIIQDAVVSFLNRAMKDIMGYDSEEVIGRNFGEFTAKEYLELVKSRYNDRMEGKEVPSIYEIELINKDGSNVPVELNASRIEYQGKPAGLVVVRNITERKNAELLQNSVYRISQEMDASSTIEEAFHAVHDTISHVMPADNFFIALYDEEQDLITYPYHVDQVNEKPNSNKPGRGLIEHILRNGESLLYSKETNIGLRIRCEDIEMIGEHCKIWMGVPLKIEGKTIGVMTVQHYSDSHAYGERELQLLEYVSTQIALAIRRKQTEESLRESEELFRTAFHTSPDAVSISSVENGRFAYINEGFTNMIGFSQNEVIGKTAFDIDFWDNPDDRKELVRGLKEKGYYRNLEAKFNTKNGEKIIGLMSAETLMLNDVPHLLAVIRDVTDLKAAEETQKELEQQFRQSQKMEAVGRLAGGVAHDFNNLLTAILGHSELSLLSLNENDPLHSDIKEIYNAANRASHLTRQLLAFSRKQKLQPKILNLNEIIINLEKMLQRIIGEDINLTHFPVDNLLPVKLDPGQIEQVIVNLVVNARDAMSDGGNLTIETQNVDLDESYSDDHAKIVPGKYVMLAVSDNGMGMTEEVRRNIFEPFFTTKGVEKGTGLGLATVYGIVKQSEGYIWVYSELGKGTTFKMYFPAVTDKSPDKIDAFYKSKEIPSGNETILVVEDEDSVRKMAVRVLKMQGYDVHEARSGGDALILCQKLDKKPSLVLTDIVMPHMKGTELAKAIKEKEPEIKVLFMSGYTPHAIVNEQILKNNDVYLQKPFRPADLARKVRDVLDNKKQD
jgi:PAS domain S-box-containing protein